MSHNRCTNSESEEITFKETCVESLAGHEAREADDGMVHVMDRIPNKEKHSDSIEITQQQMSRVAALILLGAALTFFVGYTMGSYRVRGVDRIKDDAFSFLYTMFTEPSATGMEEAHVDSMHDRGIYGCFATLEEADKLSIDLKRCGKNTKVLSRCSLTVSGREVMQYLVAHEELKDATPAPKQELCKPALCENKEERLIS